MRAAYREILLPGTVCVSMVMSGVWGVAMPLILEFGFTREIEDRLLAPIAVGWLAVEKVAVGMTQALTAGAGGISGGVGGDGAERGGRPPAANRARRARCYPAGRWKGNLRAGWAHRVPSGQQSDLGWV